MINNKLEKIQRLNLISYLLYIDFNKGKNKIDEKDNRIFFGKTSFN
jgi:hypothetical protein